MEEAKVLLDCRNVVGESAVWSAEERSLYWVDIVGGRIHRFEPETETHESWSAPELPTSIGLRRDGGFVVGLRRRVALWSKGGGFETLAVPEPDLPNNRLNEGVVAPDGSFWVGTMRDNIGPDGRPVPVTEPSGALYRVESDGSVVRLTEHRFGITNTMVWLSDSGFVTADTSENALYRFDYDTATRKLRNRQPFGPRVERGLPDGSAQSAAGSVYNCRVAGGASIAVIEPGAEDKVRYIDLPCNSPTSCVFGGPDYRTLYVTSARFGMDPDALRANPVEGALMSVSVDEAGAPCALFG